MLLISYSVRHLHPALQGKRRAARKVIRVGWEHSRKVVVCVKETSHTELIMDESLLLLKQQNTKLDGFASVEKLLKDGSQTIAFLSALSEMQQLSNPYKQGRQGSSLQASLFEILIELVPVSVNKRFLLWKTLQVLSILYPKTLLTQPNFPSGWMHYVMPASSTALHHSSINRLLRP